MGQTAPKEDQFEVTSRILYPDNVRILQEYYKQIFDPESETVFRDPFIKFMDLPSPLSGFSDKFFRAISTHQIESEQSTSPRKKGHHKHHHNNNNQEKQESFNFKQIVQVMENIYRGNSSQHARLLFRMYQKDDKLGEEEFKILLLDCALISELNKKYYTMDNDNEDFNVSDYKKRIDSVAQSLNNLYPFPVDCGQLISYFGINLPSLGKGLEYFVWYKFLHEKKTEKDEDTVDSLEFWPPYLMSSDLSTIPEINSLIWLLASAIEIQQSTWKVIYTATNNGQSLNRLGSCIFHYGGPTIIIILDNNGGIFGGYTTEIWTANTNFRSDKSSFLFALTPHFGIYRATGSDSNNVYFSMNTDSYMQFPSGVGFGGNKNGYRLWLNDGLGSGESREICTSFARGKLSTSVLFKTQTMEVWGCGGHKAEEAQVRGRFSEEKEIEKRRKVKKELITETWDSGPSKYLMDLTGRTGHADAFLDDIRKIRKMREEQRAEQEKKIKKNY